MIDLDFSDAEKTWPRSRQPHPPRGRGRNARNQKIVEMRLGGASFAACGRAFGLSGGRVKQIVDKYNRCMNHPIPRLRRNIYA